MHSLVRANLRNLRPDMSSPTLSSAQKSFLRGLGQTTEPTIKVGKSGLTPAFFAELNRLLAARELVKLRFVGVERAERDTLVGEIATGSGSILAGQVGHTALFYREQPDPEKRLITF
jgi:RNA-binding protein